MCMCVCGELGWGARARRQTSFSARSTRRKTSLISVIGIGTLQSLTNWTHSRCDIVKPSVADLAAEPPRLAYSKKSDAAQVTRREVSVRHAERASTHACTRGAGPHH